MNKILFFISILLTWSLSLIGQEEKMEIQGAIQIADSEDPSPDSGTIRWTGNDFEGWDGTEWVSLTSGNEYVKDIEHNKYKIVTIGTQTWMAENLRVTRCNDGTPIPFVTDNTEWSNLTTGAFTMYNNSSTTYGALYNWYALDECNICPTGWHVPSDTEWSTLSIHLGGIAVSGGKLKEAGIINWYNLSPDATNETGWSGIPGGSRDSQGDFHLIGISGYWWSSTVADIVTKAWARNLHNYNSMLNRFDISQIYGLSVRCIKD